MQQFGSALIWVIMLILYAHLIPVLRSMGTALLAGASIASVVIGLAAQSTLGNLVAGISITIYRPFRLGDTIQVASPTGTEIGVVENISLGYTTLRTADGRFVVVPNALAASQVSINLSAGYSPWPITVVIRVNRDADIEAVRKLAVTVAQETVGEGGRGVLSDPGRSGGGGSGATGAGAGWDDPRLAAYDSAVQVGATVQRCQSGGWRSGRRSCNLLDQSSGFLQRSRRALHKKGP